MKSTFYGNMLETFLLHYLFRYFVPIAFSSCIAVRGFSSPHRVVIATGSILRTAYTYIVENTLEMCA